MATLKVTERGQVTFRKEVLRHLGVRPGERIELNLFAERAGDAGSGTADGEHQRIYRAAEGAAEEGGDTRGDP